MTMIKKILKRIFSEGNSVTRYSLENELRRQFRRLKPGVVMDVGSRHSPYKNWIPFTNYLRLDIDPSDKPDICCDLHEVNWQSDYFDSAIATEVLEHLYDPQKAINEIHRILKNGGVCIASTRFIYPYHAEPQDYYRFTWDSLNHLFKEFSTIEIYHHGNRIQVLWQMISDCGWLGRPLRTIFNPLIAKIHFEKTRYPSGFIVYAIK